MLRRGTPLAILGGFSIAAAIAINVSGAIPEAGAVIVGFAGWLMVVLGVGLRSDSAELTTRLKREGAWHIPTDLHGWLPRSAEQLGAVEDIADERGGLAYVRDLGGRTVEVRAMRKGRLERFWVDESGRAGLTDTQSATHRHYIDRVLQGASLALWLGFMVALFVHRWFVAAVFVGCIAATMIAGWLNDRRGSLDSQMKQFERDGQPWIEIRTQIVVNDD